jgi:hypothetical protein
VANKGKYSKSALLANIILGSKLDKNKHSSLFRIIVNNKEKSLVTLTKVVYVIKLASFITDSKELKAGV